MRKPDDYHPVFFCSIGAPYVVCDWKSVVYMVLIRKNVGHKGHNLFTKQTFFVHIYKLRLAILTGNIVSCKITTCVADMLRNTNIQKGKREEKIMKIRTLKLAACAAVMALSLSVTACGGSGDGAKPADTTEAAAPETEAAEETKEETAAPEAEKEDDAAEAEAEKDVAEAETDLAEAEDEADAAADGEYATLEDYYNDPSVKSIMDTMFDSIAEEGMSVALDVKGNVFTVIIKIEDSSKVVDGMAEALDAVLEAQTDTFKEQVKQFDDAIGQEGACTVVMRYTDPDDNVLAEKEFTAN